MGEDKYKVLESRFKFGRVKFNEPLKYQVFSKNGGNAEVFYIATTRFELIEALNIALELEVPYFVFGNGTKLMVSEQGIKGFVIRNRTGQIKIGAVKGKIGKGGLGLEEAQIEADSGVSLQKLNEYLKTQGLADLPTISSLSGTLGGSLLIDPQIQAITQKVIVWNKGDVEEISVSELDRLHHIILSVVLKLKARV